MMEILCRCGAFIDNAFAVDDQCIDADRANSRWISDERFIGALICSIIFSDAVDTSSDGRFE